MFEPKGAGFMYNRIKSHETDNAADTHSHMQKHIHIQNQGSYANPVITAINRTVGDWSKIRILGSSKFGNVDLIIEPKMDKITVKKVEKISEPLNEIYISAKDFQSLSRILTTLNELLSDIQVNTACSVQIQILLNSKKLKKEVEEFVDYALQRQSE